MIIASVFGKIDQKVTELTAAKKQPVVVLVNSHIYKAMQQEMLESDLSQAYGKIRSPHDLRIYRGMQVIASQVVDEVEVF